MRMEFDTAVLLYSDLCFHYSAGQSEKNLYTPRVQPVRALRYVFTLLYRSRETIVGSIS
jgi:hypothetical protein